MPYLNLQSKGMDGLLQPHETTGAGCCFLLKLEYYSSENLLN